MKYMLSITLSLVSVLLSGCTGDVHFTSTSWLASAAVAAVVSALVSGVIALLVKDKEYKNEYFKKVIDKRLKAIEAVEAATFLFTSHYYETTGDRREFHAYFRNNIETEDFGDAVQNMSKYSPWYSKETLENIGNFTRAVNRAIDSHHEAKTEDEQKEIPFSSYALINDLRLKLEASIRKDMASLHKVKGFFKSTTIS